MIHHTLPLLSRDWPLSVLVRANSYPYLSVLIRTYPYLQEAQALARMMHQKEREMHRRWQIMHKCHLGSLWVGETCLQRRIWHAFELFQSSEHRAGRAQEKRHRIWIVHSFLQEPLFAITIAEHANGCLPEIIWHFLAILYINETGQANSSPFLKRKQTWSHRATSTLKKRAA